MAEAALDGKSVKELRAIIHSAGLRFDDCVEKADLRRRAEEALAKDAAGGAAAAARAEGGGVWRRLRVAPGFQVPLLTEPRSDAPASARLGSGQLVLTTGQQTGQFLEVLLLMGRSAWVPFHLADGRELLLPEEGAGRHGDKQEPPGGLKAVREQHLLAMLRLEVPREPAAAGQRLPWPEGGEALIELHGHRAFLFGPDGRGQGLTPGEALPLVVVMHGASKRGALVPQGWDFGGFVEAYRSSRAAAKRNILILVPEARDHTWDLITVSGREDMDFLQAAITEACGRYAVDRARIAVAGCSDGGSMALTLAVRNPDVFEAGLAQAAGFCLMEPWLAPAGRRPRLFMEYGTKDELGFYRHAHHHRAKWAGAGYEVRFRAIEGGGHVNSPDFFKDAVRIWQSPPAQQLPAEELGGLDAVERAWPKGRLNPHGLEAVANLRDVAGIDPALPVRVRGGWLRRGMLFRSGLWNLATEADVAKLRDKLKIKTYLDLRTGSGDEALDGAVWDAYPPSPCGRHGELKPRARGDLRRARCNLRAGLEDEAEASPDLARGRRATASSERSAEKAAGRAVDGRPGTRWSSSYEDGQWLCVDLGAPHALARVDVHWEKACADVYRLQGRLDEAGAWEDLAPPQKGSEGWVSTELLRGSLARFVRLSGETRATEWGFSVWDFRVRPAASADLALGRPATASSKRSAERSAGAAVDGRRDTRWTSQYQDGQWLCVDLGAELRLARAEVLWEKACAKSYLIQGSPDGSAWATLASEEGREGWVATPLRQGSQARYVRMFGQTRATEYGFSIWQFKVYGDEAAAAETRDLAFGRPVEASTSKKPAESAVDGSSETRWTSEYADEQWLSVDLGAVLPLSRVELQWEKACARRYLLQGSDDGAAWATLAEDEGREGWVVTVLPAGSKARYVRMFGKTRATSFGFSVFHFQVYGGEGAEGPRDAARRWRRAARRHIASVPDYFCVLSRSLLLLCGEALAGALRELLEPENYPVAFGCMQGKDRTGLLSLLVLAALGASEQELVEDFLLSNEASEHNAESSRASRERYEQLKRERSQPGGASTPAESGASDAAGQPAPPEPQPPSDTEAVPVAEAPASNEAAVGAPEAAAAAGAVEDSSATEGGGRPTEPQDAPLAGGLHPSMAGSTGLEEAAADVGSQEKAEVSDSTREEPAAWELTQYMLVYKEVAEYTLWVLRKEGGVLSYLDSIGFGAAEVARFRELLVQPRPA